MAQPQDERTPGMIKTDLALVSTRLKEYRTKLAHDGEGMSSAQFNRLVAAIQADVVRQDELLGELEDALTWQNPERLIHK